jgi:hypothetical protein
VRELSREKSLHYFRSSGHVVKDIIVGKVAASLCKRHNLFSELIEPKNRKLASERVPNDFASALAECLRYFGQLPIEIVV